MSKSHCVITSPPSTLLILVPLKAEPLTTDTSISAVCDSLIATLKSVEFVLKKTADTGL